MKKYLSIILILLLTLSAFTGCYLLPKEEEALAPPLLKPVDIEYVTETCELGDIEKLIFVRGQFRPKVEHTLSFEKRGGILLEKYCSMGQEVKQGDLLFALDTETVEQDEQIAFLRYEQARLSYERAVSLSRSTFDKKMAEINKDIAFITYEKITNEVEKSKIYAPIDGVVTYMTNVNIGDYINAKLNVVKIADVNELRLIVVDDDAKKLSFGDIVEVEVLVNNSKNTYQGEVVLSPQDRPENMEETFENPTAIVEIKNLKSDNIRINLVGKITLIEASAKDVIVIKNRYIQNYFGRTFVYLLEDGVKVERDVQKGITTATRAEIVEGLEVGDVIIVN
ncbi:MAG: efflux RND transporter periplasmic adaptor subunit [Clostridiales bacterium]|nr:efflux RND transporter periplasmic adaptor subunit [Clostridiales bacterium]